MTQPHALTINGRYANIQQVCQFMTAGARQAGLDETAVAHIELACDEACTNIIEHAYGGEDKGSITAKWEVIDGHFIMKLYDNGRSFRPNKVPKPNLPTNNRDNDHLVDSDDLIANLKIGGLGIHFMRKLMDDIRYELDAETGNTLIMVKQFAGKTT